LMRDTVFPHKLFKESFDIILGLKQY